MWTWSVTRRLFPMPKLACLLTTGCVNRFRVADELGLARTGFKRTSTVGILGWEAIWDWPDLVAASKHTLDIWIHAYRNGA